MICSSLSIIRLYFMINMFPLLNESEINQSREELNEFENISKILSSHNIDLLFYIQTSYLDTTLQNSQTTFLIYESIENQH